jgi:hypothetical protein
MDMFKKNILILIFVGAFFVRLYKIDSPLADWHSWRQVDTSAVSRNYVKNGINLLRPVYDDLSNVASGKENPQGLRYVEFPIYNAIHAFLSINFQFFSLEKWGRLLTIFFSLFSLGFIYLLTKKYAGFWSGIFASFFFAFLPYSIFYSRVILPDPTMVAFSLGALWLMSKYIEEKKIIYLLVSTVLFSVALLIKPTAIFFGIPIGFLFLNDLFHKSYKTYKTYIFALVFLLSFLPLSAWRLYIQKFPEGIPASSWLLNGDGIRFKGAWWRWLFGERIGKLILGYWGVAFLSFGLISEKFKKLTVLYILIISSFIYLAIFATGNVRHDYYQIPIIPSIAIFCGIGLTTLIEKIKRAELMQKIILIIFPFTLCALTFALSWYEVQGFFNINHPEIVEAGKKVDEILPKNAKVIAPYGGDTAFLYQTNRQGWPLLYNTNNVGEQVKIGATHYVSTNFDEPTKKIMEKCKILYQNEKFVIVELKCMK